MPRRGDRNCRIGTCRPYGALELCELAMFSTRLPAPTGLWMRLNGWRLLQRFRSYGALDRPGLVGFSTKVPPLLSVERRW